MRSYRIPDKLIEYYKRGAFGIFIGSGISQSSDLPSWKTLLNELIELALDSGAVTKEKSEELTLLIEDSTKYLMVAQELADQIPSELRKYIKNRFNDEKSTPSEVLKKIINLDYRFIITTNYDTLIEKAFVANGLVPNDLTYQDAATINENLVDGSQFILKAHGDARRAPNEIILTELDYRNIIYKEPGYQAVLQSIFSMSNVLFLGVSLDDPELRLILGYIQSIFHGGSPDHYALMSSEGLTETEIARWRKDFHINIIQYDPKDNHSEVEAFIDELVKL